MRWLSYFPEIHNVHLTKDVGLIPYFIGLQPGWESAIVGRFTEADYPALNTEVKGLITVPLDDLGELAFVERAFMRYLKAHATEIDVLHLAHLGRHNIVYGLYYLRLNPNGKIYLKLDAYNAHLKQRKRHAKHPVKQVVMRSLEKRFMEALTLVSIENTAGYKLALLTYPEWQGKLIYLPNGANDRFIDRHFAQLPPKEKLLLCVSRPGSADKNCELMLAALPHLHLPEGWRIEVVGPCSDEFLEKWQAAQLEFPEKAALMTFSGEVSDRLALYERYARAAVFFLPSRMESFGIAYAEALYFGSLLVGHKGMYAYDDLSANGQFGSYYADNDPQSFAQALEHGVLLSQKEGMAEAARQHGQRNFAWSGIVEGLMKQLRTAVQKESQS